MHAYDWNKNHSNKGKGHWKLNKKLLFLSFLILVLNAKNMKFCQKLIKRCYFSHNYICGNSRKGSASLTWTGIMRNGSKSCHSYRHIVAVKIENLENLDLYVKSAYCTSK
ncbi:hypothetical protein O6H91_04G133000 [Diphasiastrum complanatum]|uniref:Uncharacterized protein n=1 Tax=Diphasiastrum complanatum TaxID=34168 RepID=A0ACC2E1X1_DIPCM|nr:hypothetical protein O6H91_04G133000 [Diphasiastrum complanatum]